MARLVLAPALLLLTAACGRGAGPETRGAEPGRVTSAVPGQTPERAFFREVTAEWGIAFDSAQRFTGDYPIAEIMGHGLALFDANGDGRLDLYLCNAGPRHGDPAPDRLYLSRSTGGFEDATAGSGLGFDGWSTGVATGDIDNDGDLDVYVGSWGPDRLYRNDGGGHFVDVTDGAGIGGDHMTTSVAFLDYDADGALDIFVTHYVAHDPHRVCASSAGGREFCAPGAYTPELDTLYRNRGDGTFEDATVAAGVGGTAASGLGVAVADLTGDGLVDIYVANDQMPNHLWANQGDGTFIDRALAVGVALSARGNVEASMGVDIADVDGNGILDIFVTHLAGETNTLYTAGARGTFRDASMPSGVGASSRKRTSFGTAFTDVDLDGAIDLVVSNGRVSRRETVPGAESPGEFVRYAEPNQILLNDGTGGFREVSCASDGFCARVEVTRGLVVGDLDGDGDADLAVSNIGGPVRVFENVAERRGAWLRVVACDPGVRREVRGCRIVVRAGGRSLARPAGGGWSYMSASAGGADFGLGPVERFDGIDVVWPDGTEESFDGGPVERIVVVERGAGRRR